MNLLSRRLFNGGFNHLKSTAHLLRKTPRVVYPSLGATRLCSTKPLPGGCNDKSPTPAVGDEHQHTAPSHKQPLNDSHMSAYKDFAKHNEAYVASFGDKGNLPLPPGKKLLIVTCMDARINVYAELGIQEGEAHIVRNAGGSAKEALRSIVISQRLLGTREIAVFHHTGCGMFTFTGPELRAIVKDSDPANAALKEVDNIDFLEFQGLEESVKEDVKFLLEHPLVLPETKITGWVYEVETGKIRQVV
ncbi:carbonic anhydrase [Ganoderma leucocontextum]|nr:carbonic anhydrase [Ganoderma leucocontextum]